MSKLFFINIVISILSNFLIRVFPLVVLRNRAEQILHYTRTIQCDLSDTSSTSSTDQCQHEQSNAVKYKMNI